MTTGQESSLLDSMPGRQEPKGRPFSPMGEGHWAEIVHAANGHRRYGFRACMGCARETGDSTGSAYVGADGNWYCGTKGANETCERYAESVRARLGMESAVIR